MDSEVETITNLCPFSGKPAPGRNNAKKVICSYCQVELNAINGKFPDHSEK